MIHIAHHHVQQLSTQVCLMCLCDESFEPLAECMDSRADERSTLELFVREIKAQVRIFDASTG